MNSLQSLRFVFALMIFFHHITDVGGNSIFPAGGACAVSFFFMLSGFILSMVYGERVLDGTFDYSTFLVKRVSKIYPIHLLCLVVWVIVVIDLSCLNLNRLCRLMPNFLLLQSWIPDSGLYFSGNPLSWFLSDMIFLYIIFPYLILSIFSRKEKNKYLINGVCDSMNKKELKISKINIAIVIFFILLYGVVFYFIDKNMIHPLLYINPFFRMYDFIIGIVIYSIYKLFIVSFGDKIRNLSYTYKTLIEIFIISALFVQIIFYENMPERISLVSYWWLVLALLIFVFALFETEGGGLITMILKNKIILFMGNISFCIYMTHILVIHIVNTIEYDMIYRTVISFILTIFLSTILHYWYEKPISSLIIKSYETKCI